MERRCLIIGPATGDWLARQSGIVEGTHVDYSSDKFGGRRIASNFSNQDERKCTRTTTY